MNERAEMRAAPAKEMSSKDRAAKRADELMGRVDDISEGIDEFGIPEGDQPEGWTYEWKRHKVLNQEDPSYQVQLAHNGWDAVPADRHPNYMPTNYTGVAIERKGMVLMERPTVINEKIKALDKQRARDQVRNKEAEIAGTPNGTLPRDADARTRPRISKGFEAPIAVPE